MKRFLIALIVLVLLLFPGASGMTEWVVVDGNRTLYYCGTERTAEGVLAALGFSLRGCDRVVLSSEDGRRVLHVRRLWIVTVDCLGQRRYLPSCGEPVGALLARYGLPQALTLSCERELPSFDGLRVSLRAARCAVRRFTDALPPRTLRFYTDALAPGEERVLCPGSGGRLSGTEAVLLENGRELSRVTLSRESSEGVCDRLLLVGIDRTLPVRRTLTPGSEDFTYRRKLRVEATAYSCEGCVGTTAVGTVARVGAIAVDPKVIPYGTRLYVVSDDGTYVYGTAVAEDCGAFRGNRIDLYFDTVAECITFGRRMCTVYVLD